MKIEVYFSHSFVSPKSSIYKVKPGLYPTIIQESETDTEALIKAGWSLRHAIKTSQSAQLESFNFLLIFEKE